MKVYRAGVDPAHPQGGRVSQWLDSLPVGSKVPLSGPHGRLLYRGGGTFHFVLPRSLVPDAARIVPPPVPGTAPFYGSLHASRKESSSSSSTGASTASASGSGSGSAAAGRSRGSRRGGRSAVIERSVRHVGMVAGGTGITPMLQLLRAMLAEKGSDVKVSLLVANRSPEDILCADELHQLSKHPNVDVAYTVDRVPDSCKNTRHTTTTTPQDRKTALLLCHLNLDCPSPPCTHAQTKENGKACLATSHHTCLHAPCHPQRRQAVRCCLPVALQSCSPELWRLQCEPWDTPDTSIFSFKARTHKLSVLTTSR